MNSKCEQIRQQIADSITTAPPEKEKALIEAHLSECSSCKEYFEALYKEDKLLSRYFAELDEDMQRQEDEVIRAVDYFVGTRPSNVISFVSTFMENRITKLAGVAAVIGLFTAYLVTTLNWIQQMEDLIVQIGESARLYS